MTTGELSRRTAMTAILVAAAGGQIGRALAQQDRVFRNETDWQRRGVTLAGKTALVTGSTDGLGREVARQLGALGAFVIVHGRNAERGEQVVRTIRSAGPGDAVFYQADFASLAEVRAFGARVLDAHERLHLLINNAAAPAAGERRTTADGYELAFAVNYLSHFLLTHLLLPRIEASAPARIVNVSSMGQAPIDFDDVMMERGEYDAADAYRRSKLAQIMFTIDLARQLDPNRVTVTAVHPARSMNTTRVIAGGFQPLSTVEEGAESVMNLAVSPEVAGVTGVYFNQLNEAQANPQAYDEAARARLWELSLELAGLS